MTTLALRAAIALAVGLVLVTGATALGASPSSTADPTTVIANDTGNITSLLAIVTAIVGVLAGLVGSAVALGMGKRNSDKARAETAAAVAERDAALATANRQSEDALARRLTTMAEQLEATATEITEASQARADLTARLETLEKIASDDNRRAAAAEEQLVILREEQENWHAEREETRAEREETRAALRRIEAQLITAIATMGTSSPPEVASALAEAHEQTEKHERAKSRPRSPRGAVSAEAAPAPA